jgi:hypothetical protein
MSMNPLEDRASTAVRHQGDRAWKADQVVVPTERVRLTESTVTSPSGDARETNKVTSDFRGINQVGEEEYQRTLASMRSEGASDEQAYAVASETRNRVTSVGGTEIERAREALQKEQAAEALADLEADGMGEGVASAEADRNALSDAVGISEEEGIDVADRDTNLDREGLALENGVAEDQAGLDTVAIASGVAEEAGLDSQREELLANVESDFDALEAALDNGNVLDLEIEQQFSVVESLKEARVEELTAAPTLKEGVEFGVEEEIDPELARRIDEQFEEIRDIVNRREAALRGEEPLTGMEREQLALGATEEEALTF